MDFIFVCNPPSQFCLHCPFVNSKQSHSGLSGRGWGWDLYDPWLPCTYELCSICRNWCKSSCSWEEKGQFVFIGYHYSSLMSLSFRNERWSDNARAGETRETLTAASLLSKLLPWNMCKLPIQVCLSMVTLISMKPRIHGNSCVKFILTEKQKH